MELRLASVENLPGFGGKFDRVYTINSAGFWKAPLESLTALRGVMAPSGKIAIAEQPRMKGATVADASTASEKYTRLLEQAGFTGIRTEILELDPPAACVIGVNA
jgi:hypothetical protein